MRAVTAILAATVVAILPVPGASATLGPYPFLEKEPYILRRPAHEHCKHYYARRNKVVKIGHRRVRQVWCEYRIPTRVELSVGPDHEAEGYGAPRGAISVGASVYYEFGGSQTGATGPASYTILDSATHKRIAAFKEPNDERCGIDVTPNQTGTEETLTGIALPGVLAGSLPCPMPRATMRAADGAVVIASFAGSSQYWPSVSAPVQLPGPATA